jgi:hypothetical protein
MDNNQMVYQVDLTHDEAEWLVAMLTDYDNRAGHSNTKLNDMRARINTAMHKKSG